MSEHQPDRAESEANDSANDNERSDRDPRGRYLPGHAIPGPGRTPGFRQKDAEERWLAIASTLTPARWQGIVERMIKRAEDGDDKAIDWLTRHIVTDSTSAQRLDIEREKLDAGANTEPPEVRVIIEGVSD